MANSSCHVLLGSFCDIRTRPLSTQCVLRRVCLVMMLSHINTFYPSLSSHIYIYTHTKADESAVAARTDSLELKTTSLFSLKHDCRNQKHKCLKALAAIKKRARPTQHLYIHIRLSDARCQEGKTGPARLLYI
jgi:hypothetical protein